jgi:hypothetical protein
MPEQPQVSEVYSNLKRSTKSYDDELRTPQAHLDYLATLPMGDRKPTPEEQDTLWELEAANYMAAAGQRWKDQDRFMGAENEAMRRVNFLSPMSIFRKLRQAGVDARSETPSFYVWMPDDSTGKLVAVKKERSIGRLWLADVAVQDRVGVSAWVIEKGVRVRKQITTLQYPYGSEWSLLHFDKNDVPIAEKFRGWRTAMMHLIEANVLTEEEVDRAFGKPAEFSPASYVYRRQLQTHRARRMGLIQ